MVISSHLSLVPYPLDSQQTKPSIQPAVVLKQQEMPQMADRHHIFRNPKSCRPFINANNSYGIYNISHCKESPKIDQIGVMIDIYV